MDLRGLKFRLSGAGLVGERALRGQTLHLGHLRNVFDTLVIPGDVRMHRPFFLLAFTNRSGSTYLGRLLASAPDLYGFREDLNHTIVARRVRESGLGNLSSYLAHIVGLQSKHGAGFGLKASAEQLRLVHMTRMDRAFEGTRVIRIRRRDRVAQAVSLWTAWQTRQWTSLQTTRHSSLHYDYRALRRALQSVQEAESALDLVLSVLPYKVFTVEYEALCDDPAAEIASLREKLGLPPFRPVRQCGLERQSSQQKRDFVHRFRSDLARAWELPPN